MGYEKQYAYKKGARPYGEPSAGTNFKDASPRPQTVGASRKVPVVIDDAVNIDELISITLTADHRLIDGAVGAKFLNAAPANAWLNARPPYADKSGNPASCWNKAL